MKPPAKNAMEQMALVAEIMAEVGFEGTLADFFEFTRTDPQFYYPDTDEGRQRYLDESTAMIEQMMEVAPDYFGRLPQGELEVRAVEPFRAQTARRFASSRVMSYGVCGVPAPPPVRFQIVS